MSNIQTAEEPFVVAAKISKSRNNSKEDFIATDSNCEQKCSKGEHETLNPSDPLNNDKLNDPKCASGEADPVRITLERINEDESSALNLKASQQFPVVTRRFRQLQNQFSKELVEENPKKIQQDASNAELAVAPISELKCEISVMKPIDGCSDTGDKL